MDPIFEIILKNVPPAPNFLDKPFRMQVANLAYDDYL
jgi:predicted membrane GTPase involved in stress response